MKKYLLIAGLALVTTAGVTATVLNSSNKKKSKKVKKECVYKKSCSKSSKVASYSN
jgi:hypothetical protein